MCDETVVVTFFSDGAIFEYDDALSHSNSGEAMGNEERHLAFSELVKTFEHFVLGAGIQSGSWLVEYQDLGVPQVSSC